MDPQGKVSDTLEQTQSLTVFGLSEMDFPFLKVGNMGSNRAFVVKKYRQETLHFEVTGNWMIQRFLINSSNKLVESSGIAKSHLPVVGKV